jgi:hypothetical protein
VEKIDVCGRVLCCFSFKNLEDHFTWAFAGVYDPNVNGDRRFLWDELTSLPG